jgi:septal ring factor EnvC (AmiA/AmiB activator)
MRVSDYGFAVNEYYHQHPHHIIGKLAVIDMYGRKGLTCKKDSENTFEKLKQLIEDKRQTSQGNPKRCDLKAQLSALCQELNTLSQALIATGEAIQGIHQKIMELETSS